MFLLIGTGIALDVPFVFDEASSGVASYNSNQIVQSHFSSPDLIGVPTVTQVEDNEILAFPVTGGGSAPERTTDEQVGELKKAFDAAVEPDNSRVHEEAVVLALKYPGDLTIDQIASIYSYLKNGDGSKKGWGYVRDPRGIDYFNYANASLKLGDRANYVGGGDCDDFAILMAALVESIGGTTRIILARNNSTGGHAYTEVYLGQLCTKNSQVEDIINWLKQKFNTDKIYTHIDTDTKDVWLNLDWGADEKGNAHPGGPFYLGDKHIVLCIRDRYEKTALKLSDTYVTSITCVVNQTVFEPSQDGKNTGDQRDHSNNYAVNYSAVREVNYPVNEDGIATNSSSYSEQPSYARNYAVGDFISQVNLLRLGNPTPIYGYQVKFTWSVSDLVVTPTEWDIEGQPTSWQVVALQDGEKTRDQGNQEADDWVNKGNALLDQNGYDEAIKCYNEAIKLNPNDAYAWYCKGNALKIQGKYDEAIKASDEAVRLNPNESAAWETKGAALNAQGKRNEAIKAYEEAIKAHDEAIRLNPNDDAAWWNKGVDLEALGRTGEADAAFAKAKELDPAQ